MGKFSDSPYFLLRDFFYEAANSKGIEKPIASYKSLLRFVSTINGTWDDTTAFTKDNSTGTKNIVYTNFNSTVWNLDYYYNPNIVRSEGYIVAPEVNVTAYGGGIYTLYIKDLGQGYLPISVRYKNTDKNTFHFINSGVNDFEEGTHIIETLTNSYSYNFEKWDIGLSDSFNFIEDGMECYFRKDGYYHDWLKTTANAYYKDKWNTDFVIRNYVNTDKIFTFFDYIYKSHDESECRVIFDGMKDYVMRAIPEHQRTQKFTEFQEVFYDRVYQEIFDLLKNIWTLLDPMEVDKKYLGYLSKYYDMFDVNLEFSTPLHVREFIRDMVWMIKRKGTYTEYFILWKILTATSNRLNIYERWHTNDIINRPETHVIDDDWEDYLYTYKDEYHSTQIEGGAGPVYYAKNYPTTIDNYPTTGKVLSTHFIIELDISDKPLLKYEIITEALWNMMNNYWEYIRPVNRVCEYRIVIAPKTNFTGNDISLYDSTTAVPAYLNTISSVYSLNDLGAYVHNQKIPTTEWVFSHNLGSKGLLVQCVDRDLTEVVPADIIFVDDNNVKVLFTEPVSGYALLKRADIFSRRVGNSLDEVWNIYHLRKRKEVIVHYQLDDKKMYEKDTLLVEGDIGTVDQDRIIAFFNDGEVKNAPVSKGYIFIQDEPSITWNIPHGMHKKGVITNVYDDNDFRMHPSEYKLVDVDNIQLTFETPVSGYVVLVTVGNLSFDDILADFEDKMKNPTWKIYAKEGDHDAGVPEIDSGQVNSIYQDDFFIYLDIMLPIKNKYIIEEIAIFNDDGLMVFYTHNSEMYKPNDVDLTLHYRIEKKI